MQIEINKNFENLSQNYLFAETAKKASEYKERNPDKKIINLGIGDVSLPLSVTVLTALKSAIEEQGKASGFRGYAPYGGYGFMKNAVVSYYKEMNIAISAEDVFISDGAKSDIGNILDIFGTVDVLIPTPCYPAYVDVNIIKGNKITYLPTETDSFVPDFGAVEAKPYLIYICSPNNPTGVVYDKELLTNIVGFAKQTNSIIIFDAAYSAFVRGVYAKSIFEIDGAEACAIEINSLSKSHGFTGLRLGWCVISEKLTCEGRRVKELWERRLGSRYNGVPYVVQRAGEAALSPQGLAESRKQTDYYLENAKILKQTLGKSGVTCSGGEGAPYVWFKCPLNMDGYAFFDYLLKKAQIVGTVGGGFGEKYNSYFRFSAFADRENILLAAERLLRLF